MACSVPGYRREHDRLFAIRTNRQFALGSASRAMIAHFQRHRLGRARGLGLLAIVAAGLVPVIVDDQYVLDVLTQAGLFILLAIGLNIVVSLAGLLDVGYIAFWAIGAYLAAMLASPHVGIFVPFLLLLPLSIVAASGFALIIGFPTLRLRGDYLAIVTLGFGEIVRLSLLNGGTITGGPSGIQGIFAPSVLGFEFSYRLEPYYYLIYFACLAALVVAHFIHSSKIGVIWQALRDDELAARTSGLRPLTYYLLAFGIGASFGGISGVLFATKQLNVSPDSFTVDQSFLVLEIVVLAGLSGRPWPVALSAVLVICLPELLREFQEYRLVLFGPLLVVVVVLRERSKEIGQFASKRVRWPRFLARRTQ